MRLTALILVAALSGTVMAGTDPGCLPEAPGDIPNAGVWVTFHLYPGNHPVLPVTIYPNALSKEVVPVGDVDLCRQPVASRRFDRLDARRADALNRELRGNDYPLVTALIGLLGKPGAAVSTIRSVLEAAGDPDSSAPDVRARAGDELWRVDFVGRDGRRLVYAYYVVLVDPYRGQAWVLNENRKRLVLEKE